METETQDKGATTASTKRPTINARTDLTTAITATKTPGDQNGHTKSRALINEINASTAPTRITLATEYQPAPKGSDWKWAVITVCSPAT